MSDYSFEIAHIYGDRERIGPEQQASIDRFLKYIANEKVGNADLEVTVWLDDYNPLAFNLEVAGFVDAVESAIHREVLIASERKVADQYPKFEIFLEPKSREYYERYFERYQKLPCSLVTAMWYCLRLSDCSFSGNVYFDDTLSDVELAGARKVVNFLPKKYANAESKTKEIFTDNPKLSPFLDKIDTRFF